jgi:hypothetical protein
MTIKDLFLPGFLVLTLSAGASSAADVSAHRNQPSWGEALLNARASLKSQTDPPGVQTTNLLRCCERLQADYPINWDWALQDSGGVFSEWFLADANTEWERRLIARVLEELPGQGGPLRQEFSTLCHTNVSPLDRRWWDLYLRACEQRRARRLETVRTQAPQFIFTKRRTLQPSFFGYTEGQSDAQNERHFRPNSHLCLWTLDGCYGSTRTLLSDATGAIRDPAASWDGKRVLFAWKKSLNDDDYHLYDLAVESGTVRQLTCGLGFADYEPAYLPDGDIVFASTRGVQTVDCWWTEVSNLYTCDADGRNLRRLGFDQVHTLYPQVLDDGRVIYTRWDYNDRGQMFPQALFQMNPDGTGQTEFYKNNSWFPTTVGHARGIPGTQKVLAIFMGHHTAQAGKLGILDPARGRQEAAGAQLIAPVRETPPERRDVYGQEGELFQYPFPLTETEFLVGFAPLGWQESQRRKGGADFGIYWMDCAGRRELLVNDPALACQQPVPLVARRPPPLRPSTVDYHQTSGVYTMQDIYAGDALAGVPRGTVKKLRVIALHFRAAGIGNNGSTGPSGEALVSTPVSVGNGSWDVKTVLGDAKVYDDGSACFTVPARTPVYFQALDEYNRAVQTMRSWSTLQPGENQACVGCHESKNTTPLVSGRGFPLALKAGPQPLEPFYGPPRGFSFAKEIQPILDRHCIRCHNDPTLKMEPKRQAGAVTRTPDPVWRHAGWLGKAAATSMPDPDRRQLAASAVPDKPAFSLLSERTLDKVAKRYWSRAYLALTLSEPTEYYEAAGAFIGVFDGRMVNWIGSQSVPAPLPPFAAGACQSELLVLLQGDHYGVKLSRADLDKLACWMDLLVPFCGDYFEANAWTVEEREKYESYLAKRRRMEALEGQSIQPLLRAEETAARQ